MPFTTEYSNDILNMLFGKKSATVMQLYDRIYLALSSNDPTTSNGAFSELGGNGYERVLISNRAETYPNLIGEASERKIKNEVEIHFKQSTDSWPTAHGIGLYGVNVNSKGEELTPVFLWYGSLASNPLVVDKAGMVPLLSEEALTIAMAESDQPLT